MPDWTQADWDDWVLNDPAKDVWQNFKMDESSGLPQDSGHYAGSVGCHMTAGSVNDWELPGPFDGALAIEVTPANAGDVVRSPVYTPSPATDVNFGAPKNFGGWVYLNEDCSSDNTTLLAVGNVALQIDSDNKLKLRSFWNPGSVTAKGSTALNTGEWYLLMVDMLTGTSDCEVYIGDVDGSFSHEVSAETIFWPIPNPHMLRLGPQGFGPYFQEADGQYLDALWSNCFLFDNGAIEPGDPPEPFVPHIYRRLHSK